MGDVRKSGRFQDGPRSYACTTWDVKNPLNDGKNLPTSSGAGFLNHQQKQGLWILKCHWKRFQKKLIPLMSPPSSFYWVNHIMRTSHAIRTNWNIVELPGVNATMWNTTGRKPTTRCNRRISAGVACRCAPSDARCAGAGHLGVEARFWNPSTNKKTVTKAPRSPLLLGIGIEGGVILLDITFIMSSRVFKIFQFWPSSKAGCGPLIPRKVSQTITSSVKDRGESA